MEVRGERRDGSAGWWAADVIKLQAPPPCQSRASQALGVPWKASHGSRSEQFGGALRRLAEFKSAQKPVHAGGPPA